MSMRGYVKLDEIHHQTPSITDLKQLIICIILSQLVNVIRRASFVLLYITKASVCANGSRSSGLLYAN